MPLGGCIDRQGIPIKTVPLHVITILSLACLGGWTACSAPYGRRWLWESRGIHPWAGSRIYIIQEGWTEVGTSLSYCGVCNTLLVPAMHGVK